MRVFAMASQSKWSVLDLLVHSLECVAGAMLLCGRVISWPNLPGLGMRWPCSRRGGGTTANVIFHGRERRKRRAGRVPAPGSYVSASPHCSTSVEDSMVIDTMAREGPPSHREEKTPAFPPEGD